MDSDSEPEKLDEILREIQALRAEVQEMQAAPSLSFAELSRPSKSVVPTTPTPSLPVKKRPSDMGSMAKWSRVQVMTDPTAGSLKQNVMGCLLYFYGPMACILLIFIMLLMLLLLISSRQGAFGQLGPWTGFGGCFLTLPALVMLKLSRDALRSEDFNLAFQALNRYVTGMGYVPHPLTKGRWCGMVLFWFLCVAGFLCQVLVEANLLPDDVDMSLSLLFSISMVKSVLFILSSAILLQVAIFLLNAVDGLRYLLQCWCDGMMQEQDFEAGVESWNTLQAIFQTISSEISLMFSVLYVGGNVTFIFVVTSTAKLLLGSQLHVLQLALPCPVLQVGLAVFVLYKGVNVTEQCRRVPGFVNHLPGKALDERRQYLVRFLHDSSVGFAVHGVLLSRSLLLKQLQLYLACLSGFASLLVRQYL